MLAYAVGLTVDLDLGREVPAFLRLLILAYKPGLFDAAIVNISSDDVLLYHAHHSIHVIAHRMIYVVQQLYFPA